MQLQQHHACCGQAGSCADLCIPAVTRRGLQVKEELTALLLLVAGTAESHLAIDPCEKNPAQLHIHTLPVALITRAALALERC